METAFIILFLENVTESLVLAQSIKKAIEYYAGKNSDDLLETERVQRSIKIQPFGINNKILSRKV